MKKVTSFKGLTENYQKDIVHFDSSTEFTDYDDTQNMSQLHLGIGQLDSPGES